MVRWCSSKHCSGADAEINSICKSEGWPVNHPVLTRDSQGPCKCSCSCLAHGTSVTDGQGSPKPIETYSIGDMVTAAGLDLQWSPAPVAFSSGTTGASRQKYTVLIVYGTDVLAVTSDHVFLLSDNTLKTADRLNPKDELVSPAGNPVTISSVHIGDYTAGFHHIATSTEQPDENLSGHLLDTNGVVSCDYAAQLYYRAGELPQSHLSGTSDPVVGSPEYVAAFGDDCLRTPNLQFEERAALHPLFVPAADTKILIPDIHCSFITEEDALKKAQEPKRAWNDPTSREWTEYLIRFHTAFYPDVRYHLDWSDDSVNAYAWVENGNERHVSLKGGLVRHNALELEGIALVLAHELAHHYGGLPTFPHGLSCEGQADYYGVAAIMRTVWFGEYYLDAADKAIAQMANFFGVPNSDQPPEGNAGCNHPTGTCRVATYHSAIAFAGRPGCAG